MIYDNFAYELSCPICDVSTEVIVLEIDEKPNYCPMCGEDAEVTMVETEED